MSDPHMRQITNSENEISTKKKQNRISGIIKQIIYDKIINLETRHCHQIGPHQNVREKS